MGEHFPPGVRSRSGDETWNAESNEAVSKVSGYVVLFFVPFTAICNTSQ